MIIFYKSANQATSSNINYLIINEAVIKVSKENFSETLFQKTSCSILYWI